jgi:GNAT superfamily N-acetyltransferase
MTDEAALHVRSATPADVDLLNRFVRAVAQESEGRHLDQQVVRAGLEKALADPAHRRYYVAEHDGTPVGCCLVTTEWSDWSGGWYWWLQSIWVEPAMRGDEHGVLKGLLEHVHDEARRHEVKKVALYVHRDNHRAVRAYEKRGYHPAPYLIFEHPL